MDKKDIINKLLNAPKNQRPQSESAEAYAPSNIALCKYWGKRDSLLNLPNNASLSISLADKGARTKLTIHDCPTDVIFLNHQPIALETSFSSKIVEFLNLLLPKRKDFFRIETEVNIPIAAGVASSASGFAALVQALDRLYAWQLAEKHLSILARLGSGSACRSLWHGFVEWPIGRAEDGMDSYGIPLDTPWPDLRIGLLIIADGPKPISSRDAMAITVKTSPFYSSWLTKAAHDLTTIKQAIADKDFTLLGNTVESNALAMHATMHTASPAIIFSLSETMATIQKIGKLRSEGINVYFTQDAGPNLKLLFLDKDIAAVSKAFPTLDIINPFTYLNG